MKKILVVNGPSYAESIKGLGIVETKVSSLLSNPEEFSLVLFTGGSDITPEYYGESSPRRFCQSNQERDRQEIEIFKLALKNNIRMIGICRGVQFLNVMAGGKMYHDVSNHTNGSHSMKTMTGHKFKINSFHHQMVIPPRSAHVVGWSAERMSKSYAGDYDLPVTGPDREPETVLFPNIESAGVQYHPEVMPENSAGYLWFYDLAKALIKEPDFSSIVKYYTENQCHSLQLYTPAVQ